MASYFLRSKHISRGKGARVTRAAAYRAGERIRDERTSEVYDYSDRNDVACKEVVLPSDLAGRDDMSWTQDRGTASKRLSVNFETGCSASRAPASRKSLRAWALATGIRREEVISRAPDCHFRQARKV